MDPSSSFRSIGLEHTVTESRPFSFFFLLKFIIEINDCSSSPTVSALFFVVLRFVNDVFLCSSISHGVIYLPGGGLWTEGFFSPWGRGERREIVTVPEHGLKNKKYKKSTINSRDVDIRMTIDGHTYYRVLYPPIDRV